MNEIKNTNDFLRFMAMVRWDSGCELAESFAKSNQLDSGFMAFQGLFVATRCDPCKECSYKPCKMMKIKEANMKQSKKENFGKHSHKTNAEIAEELNSKFNRVVTPRQVSKMRKRGELKDYGF